MIHFPRYVKKLNLQAKILTVLIAVIVPTFIVVTYIENRMLTPFLEDEIKQIGIGYGKALSSELESEKLLTHENSTQLIEKKIQELMYLKPNIVRIDVYGKVSSTKMKLLATNIIDEDDQSIVNNNIDYSITDEIIVNQRTDVADVSRFWEVNVPINESIKHKSGKIIGLVRVWVSVKIIDKVSKSIFKVTLVAGLILVTLLVLLLSFFLRRTIQKEKLLIRTQDENLFLSNQFFELQRNLMNNEKLAAMGQLTANFAHEIGTPLNAMSGHLNLLESEVSNKVEQKSLERIKIINTQLDKIVNVVRNFLQTTAKPESQKQLCDLNKLIDRAFAVSSSRIDSSKINFSKNLELELPPVRGVPIEFEQMFLNIFNNAIDAINSKSKLSELNISKDNIKQSEIKVSSTTCNINGENFIVLEFTDTGSGISNDNLKKVFKPFFTTKKIGEGTGLGLSICQDTVKKYGGELTLNSSLNEWTKVTIKFPIGKNV